MLLKTTAIKGEGGRRRNPKLIEKPYQNMRTEIDLADEASKMWCMGTCFPTSVMQSVRLDSDRAGMQGKGRTILRL